MSHSPVIGQELWPFMWKTARTLLYTLSFHLVPERAHYFLHWHWTYIMTCRTIQHEHKSWRYLAVFSRRLALCWLVLIKTLAGSFTVATHNVPQAKKAHPNAFCTCRGVTLVFKILWFHNKFTLTEKRLPYPGYTRNESSSFQIVSLKDRIRPRLKNLWIFPWRNQVNEIRIFTQGVHKVYDYKLAVPRLCHHMIPRIVMR